ncbi:alanine racemase [Microbacterium sp. CIAB417]|uniref:alanine racemase n=1 Tax=Microbacterium sp. CIAB417 TaxID=2860287 RepID=UPI001FAC5781|nr:alanine racemase [Microbacterium sp. CIAB417]
MGPVLEISRPAFLADVAAVRARITPSQLMLVVKDDAYGHGISWSAEAAADAGVEWFGSYDVPAGLRVREAIGGRGRVFAWATSEDEDVADAVAHDIDLGVGTRDYLARIRSVAARLSRTARVHLKIDTGLHRNGVRPEEWADAVAEARAGEDEGSVRVVGIWSHIAEAGDAEDDAAQERFRGAVRQAQEAGLAPEVLHLTASAASWWRPELRESVSRIGAFCYGIRSADGPDLDGIRPIATLSAPVVGVEDGSVRVGLGSLDGYPSTLAGASVGTPVGPVTVRRVDLDTLTVDAWPGAAIGDRVRLFGPGDQGEPSATDLAERIDTVGEEILTRLSPRVQRVVTG